MTQEEKLNKMDEHKKMSSSELRNLLLEKEDSLDSIIIRLQKIYGREIPKEEYNELQDKRENIKLIEFEILKRFKSMEIK